MVVAVSGCGLTGPIATFDESEAGAREIARLVADAIGDSARLERVTIDAALAHVGYNEDSREDFAVGPFRLWAGPDDRTVSVTIVTDEQAVRIKTRGVCARPPE